MSYRASRAGNRSNGVRPESIKLATKRSQKRMQQATGATANDAISEVSDLGGGNYEGRISGATFPLVKLQPVAGPSRRGAFLLVDRRGDGVALHAVEATRGRGDGVPETSPPPPRH